jgi:hypothetical protein
LLAHCYAAIVAETIPFLLEEEEAQDYLQLLRKLGSTFYTFRISACATEAA